MFTACRQCGSSQVPESIIAVLTRRYGVVGDDISDAGALDGPAD